MNRPAFRFRLERVRALRERVEDLAKEDLATSLSHRLKGEAMLASASATVSEARAHRRESGSAPAISGPELLAAQAYLERTERARQAAELELDRREAEVDARRTALHAAARDRQALERLKARRRADHEVASRRAEGAVLDEMAITAHRRAEAGR